MDVVAKADAVVREDEVVNHVGAAVKADVAACYNSDGMFDDIRDNSDDDNNDRNDAHDSAHDNDERADDAWVASVVAVVKVVAVADQRQIPNTTSDRL
jgi:hypothetical protein